MRRSDFIEVQIEIVSSKDAEILGEDNCDRDLVRAMINPKEIAFYRADPGGDTDMDRTNITFNGGETLSVVMSMEDFEKLIFDEL